MDGRQCRLVFLLQLFLCRHKELLVHQLLQLLLLVDLFQRENALLGNLHHELCQMLWQLCRLV